MIETGNAFIEANRVRARTNPEMPKIEIVAVFVCKRIQDRSNGSDPFRVRGLCPNRQRARRQFAFAKLLVRS